MPQDNLILNKPYVITLNDAWNLDYTIQTDGIYFVKIEETATPPSGLQVLVKQNGVTKFTTPLMSPVQQEAMQAKYDLQCVATDLIRVSFMGSLGTDGQDNTNKFIITIGNGL